MGFISRLFFGKKDKNKHINENDEHLEDHSSHTASRVTQNNPMKDSDYTHPISIDHLQQQQQQPHQKMKKKLSSKYFGNQLPLEESQSQNQNQNQNEDQNQTYIQENQGQEQGHRQNHRQQRQSQRQSQSQNYLMTGRNDQGYSEGGQLDSVQEENRSPSPQRKMTKHYSMTGRTSPQTIATMMSPPPFLNSDQEELSPSLQSPPTQSLKPFVPSAQMPMVASSEALQLRGKLRQTANKRPSAMPTPQTPEITDPSLETSTGVYQSPRQQIRKGAAQPSLLQTVALKPSSQQRQNSPLTPSTETAPPSLYGRNLLKQTSQAGRLYGKQLSVHAPSTEPLSESYPHPRRKTDVPTQPSIPEDAMQPPQSLDNDQEPEASRQPKRDDENDSISTFGSQLMSQHNRTVSRTPFPGGDDGISIISSVSGDSERDRVKGRDRDTDKSRRGKELQSPFGRKASAQLKLPISRTLPPSHSTAIGTGNERRQDSMIGKTDNEEKANVSQRQMVEMKEKEFEIRPTEGISRRTDVPGILQTYSATAQIEAKEQKERRARREQEIARAKELEEQRAIELEKEEEREKYLQEEHKKWKIRDKFRQNSPTPIPSKGRHSKSSEKRSMCERLFYLVGEKKEDEDDEVEDNEGEKLKVIQGTLAAELLELIEKSRGVTKPTTIKTAATSIPVNPATTTTNSNPPQNEINERETIIPFSEEKDHDEDSFNEEDYYREIAALSLEGYEGYDIPSTNPSNQGIMDRVRLPSSLKMQGSALSKEAAKTIAKAKKREEQKAKQQQEQRENDSSVLTQEVEQNSKEGKAAISLLSNMAPLRIGMDEEWKRHEASLLSRRTSTSRRDTSTPAGLQRLKDLLQEEEEENRYISSPVELKGGRSVSTGRMRAGSSPARARKKVKDMTYRERVWSRAAGSLGGASFSSSDPVFQDLKQTAEKLGETLLERDFGPYRNIDDWEGIEVFKPKSKKPGLRTLATQSSMATTSGPQSGKDRFTLL